MLVPTKTEPVEDIVPGADPIQPTPVPEPPPPAETSPRLPESIFPI